MISSAALVAVAVALAEFADHGTGRNAAVTNRVLAARAGCCERTVTAARTVLAAAGLGMEAQRGHGSATAHTAGNRPSIWHLISRAEVKSAQPLLDPHHGNDGAVAASDVPSEDRSGSPRGCGHLRPTAVGGSSCSSPVGNYSPSTRERAPRGHCPSENRRRRRSRAAPRPLAMQRLAGQLAARCHGLGRGHVGALCDAITAAGIDPAVWSARAVCEALDADMRVTGWAWPDRIERPGAFLASRLRRLPSHPSEPQKSGGGAAANLDGKPAVTVPTPGPPQFVAPPEPSPLTEVQRARIAAAQARFRDHMAQRRSTVSGDGGTHIDRGAAPSDTTTAVSVADVCSVCGGSGGVRRPWLPPRRAMICPDCWGAANPDDDAAVEAPALSVGSASDRRRSGSGAAGSLRRPWPHRWPWRASSSQNADSPGCPG